MKKIAIVLILLLITAGICMPYFSGLITQKVLVRAVENANQLYADSGSDMRLEITAYDRKFSTSTLEWKINLGALSSVYGINELIFNEEAVHGYTGVVSQTRLDKTPGFSDLINQQLDGKNPLHIQTQYPLIGDITSTANLDAFFITKGKKQIEIKPAQFSFIMDKALKRFSSGAAWEGCKIGEELVVGPVNLVSNMEHMTQYIWDGKTVVDIQQLLIKDGQHPVEMQNLKLESTMAYAPEKNRVSAEMGLGAGLVLEDGKQQLKDAFVRVGIHQMAATGYENVFKLYTTMAHDLAQDMAGKALDQEEMQDRFKQAMAESGMKIVTEAEKLLKKDLEIKISDLKALLPQGEVKGNLSLSLKKDMTLAGFVPVMMQPAVALDIFSLQSDFSFPAEMAEDNPYLLNPVYPGMQTGMFVRTGDTLTHEARTQDGKLFINQKEVILN